MSGASPADEKVVFRPHPNAREVSRRVARLPLDYFVCRLIEHWIVVGPTGIFVVGRAGDDAATTAGVTLSMAQRIRTELANRIPWVPFIDALIVGGDDDVSLPCTVVNIGTLEMALLSGPVAIDEVGMVQLRQHVPNVLEQIHASAELDVVHADPARDTA